MIFSRKHNTEKEKLKEKRMGEELQTGFLDFFEEDEDPSPIVTSIIQNQKGLFNVKL